MERTANEIRNKTQKAAGTFGKVIDEAADLGNVASQWADKAADRLETGRKLVKENPLKGVAIAAAVGAVAGSLITLALRETE
ncbi:MAG: glycine zipper domain-containing protein [Pseudobdellovibrio sp.]